MPKVLKRIVFIDIEGTIVDDWYSFMSLPENVESILEFLEPLDTVCLFTYAAFDKKELNKTHRLGVIARDILHKPYIAEDDMHVFTKKDAMSWYLSEKYNKDISKIPYDVYMECDFDDRFPKPIAFLEMLLHDERFKDVECVLIDDMNKYRCNVEFTEKNLRITYETLEHLKELKCEADKRRQDGTGIS